MLKRLAFAGAGLIAAVAIPCSSASAHGITGEPTCCLGFADNYFHSFVSAESDDDYHTFFNHFVHYVMWGQYDPTDVDVYEYSRYGGDTHTDVVWGTNTQSWIDSYTGGPNHPGFTECYSWGGIGICDKFLVRFTQDYYSTNTSLPDSERWALVCHELGHTLGFKDPVDGTSWDPDDNSGCMRNGHDGILDSHEISDINAWF